MKKNIIIKIIAAIVGFLISACICLIIGTFDGIDVFVCGLLGSCVALLFTIGNKE